MAALSRHMQRQISIVTFEHYAKLPYSLPSRRIRDPHANRQHIFASLLIRLSDDVSISYAIKLNQPLNEKMKSHFKLSPKDARTIIGAANRSNGLHNWNFPFMLATLYIRMAIEAQFKRQRLLVCFRCMPIRFKYIYVYEAHAEHTNTLSNSGDIWCYFSSNSLRPNILLAYLHQYDERKK